MEQNDNYFSDKSEAEKLRNVSSLVDSIVNAEPEEKLLTGGAGVADDTEQLPEVNPLVDLVGKTISKGRPKGFFMQGVQTDDNTKL
jgi:hypothetical protein